MASTLKKCSSTLLVQNDEDNSTTVEFDEGVFEAATKFMRLQIFRRTKKFFSSTKTGHLRSEDHECNKC